MFEADQRRLFSQFEVWEFCDNLVEGVVKALKDVSKIQKKSTTTRASVAKPSLFINEKPKGKSENNLEDQKDFSDSLPIFDEYDEEMIESLIICEDECDLPSPKSDFMFDDEETNGLTCFEPEHPSSLVLFSQDFKEEPFDYSHQGLLLGTRRPMDDDLGPIFDEEGEPCPTFEAEAPSITSIIMENQLCFDPGTTPAPLTTYIQEHCEKLDLINFLPDLFDKVSSSDIKLSGLDHLEKSSELDLQQLVFCSRKSFDSFVFKENSFSLRSYGHELITGILFASSYALEDFMVSTLLEQNSHKAETDFCGDSVLKPVHSYSESDLELKLLCSESDQVRHVLEMFYGSSCLENILIYNTFFDKLAEPWIRNSQFELNLLCSKSEKLAHDLNLFFRNCAITCPDTILVYKTYFDRLHDDLKRVLHVLGKEILVYDLNKYLSCTYDPGILMFVLSVQDKQDQSPRGVRNRSRDRAYQFKTWRCMYSRKPTSKHQGSFFPKFSFTKFYMIFKFFLSDSFPFDTGKMDLRSNPFQEGGNDAPRIIDPGQDDATMAEPDDSSTKDKPGWINGEGTDLKPADETEDELEPAEESMFELKPAEVIVDELDELSELSDTSLELNELSDTEDGAGLVYGRNKHFLAQRKIHNKFNLGRFYTKFDQTFPQSISSPFSSRMPRGSQQGSLGLYLFVLCRTLLCFLVRLSPSKQPLIRWTCASYQATFRNPPFGGLVSHIKHQLKSGSIIGPSATHCVTPSLATIVLHHLKAINTPITTKTMSITPTTTSTPPITLDFFLANFSSTNFSSLTSFSSTNFSSLTTFSSVSRSDIKLRLSTFSSNRTSWFSLAFISSIAATSHHFHTWHSPSSTWSQV
ncbi:hypothetical protein YC2023_077721 [Brassica napus]